MRRAARVDTIHTPCIDEFKRLGCLVQDTSAIGRGFPDALVLLPSNRIILAEFKTPGAHYAKGKELTPSQVKWHLAWRRAPLYVFRSVQEVSVFVKTDLDDAAFRAHLKGHLAMSDPGQ
jgi:hypothetical protein